MTDVANPLWKLAYRLVKALALAFGLPMQIARGGDVPTCVGRVLRRALARLERVLRALLLAEALALPETKARPRRRARVGIGNAGRGGFASDRSQDWGVSFHVAPPAAAPNVARATRRESRRRPRGFVSPWPLAERFEAALRVLENPAPYVRRAAAWLHRPKSLKPFFIPGARSATRNPGIDGRREGPGFRIGLRPSGMREALERAPVKDAKPPP